MTKQVTLCLCINGPAILLAKKKVGFGAGKLNGFSSKIKDSESAEQAAIRGLKEKSGLIGKVDDLEHVVLLNFHFQGKHEYSCLVYVLHKWEGKPQETAEMERAEWYTMSNLPLGTKHMLPSNDRWLPRVLGGGSFIADIYCNKTGEKIDDFKCQKASW